MASVSIKEEPLECEVDTEWNHQIGGGSEALNKIKLEDDEYTPQIKEHCPETLRNGTEPGKRAPVIANEEGELYGRETDGRPRCDSDLKSDLEEGFHLKLIKIEVENLKREGGETEINNEVKTRPESPVVFQHVTGQWNHSGQVRSNDWELTKTAMKEECPQKRWHTGLCGCDDCGDAFPRKRDAIAHCQIKEAESCNEPCALMGDAVEKPYSCSHCGKGFGKKSHLTRHERIHAEHRPFSCTHCEKTFATNGDLSAHKKIHVGEKRFGCHLCGKGFRLKGYLTAHQKIHSGEKPFICSYCGKSFGNKSHLTSHLNVHTKEKQFICSYCGKSFSTRSLLYVHRLLHVKEKPYSCSHCGKCFSKTYQLDVHQKTHDLKQFTCSQCGRCFAKATYLTEHERIHSGEKPFSCAHCNKSFGRRAQLYKHQKIHTGERPYRCSQCGMSFLTKAHLTRHQLIHLYKNENQ